MSQPTFAVVVRFTIHPQHVADFARVVQLQAKNSLEKEAACRQFDVCFSDERPCEVFLYETYDDSAAFAAHRKTSHFAEFNSTVARWVATKDVTTWTINASR
jgi:(4S)-4-hydroxy-5-phosphonooxypentane-2,3-dione isomerase